MEMMDRRDSGAKRTKVLFVLDDFPDPHAGTEGQFWLLINQLDRRVFEPAVLLLRRSEFLERELRDVPLAVLGVHSLKHPAALPKIVAAAFRARRAGFRIAHIFFNDSAVVFPIPLRLFGLSVIVSRRDLGFWYTRVVLWILRMNALFTDVMVANCEAVKRVAGERERLSPSRMRVIYNGATRRASRERPDVIGSLSVSRDAELIVAVANLRPLKRVDDLVKAFARVAGRNPAAVLVVVGEDRPGRCGKSHRDELEELAREKGVYERVRFTGKMSDPLPIIEAASICVLCSETEGLSNAIVEYMACGKPVVCTDVGGNPELVTDGFNGYVVSVGDIDALAGRLADLLESAERRREFGRHAKERADSMLSATNMQRGYEQLYLSLERP